MTRDELIEALQFALDPDDEVVIRVSALTNSSAAFVIESVEGPGLVPGAIVCRGPVLMSRMS